MFLLCQCWSVGGNWRHIAIMAPREVVLWSSPSFQRVYKKSPGQTDSAKVRFRKKNKAEIPEKELWISACKNQAIILPTLQSSETLIDLIPPNILLLNLLKRPILSCGSESRANNLPAYLHTYLFQSSMTLFLKSPEYLHSWCFANVADPFSNSRWLIKFILWFREYR